MWRVFMLNYGGAFYFTLILFVFTAICIWSRIRSLHDKEMTNLDKGLADAAVFLSTTIAAVMICLDAWGFYCAQKYRDKEFTMVVTVNGKPRTFKSVERGIYIDYPDRDRLSTRIKTTSHDILYETPYPVEEISYTYKLIR